MKHFCIIILFLINFQFLSQENKSNYTFNIDIGLPISSGNELFKDVMQGLVSTNFYGQYRFPVNLNIAFGARYSVFTINEFAVNKENNGAIHIGALFSQVGYEKLFTNRFALDLGMKFGYSMNYANTDLNKISGINPISYEAFIFEPMLGLILYSDEQNSYRFNIAYCVQNYSFQPEIIGLLSNLDYLDSNLKNNTNYFVIGFGYTYFFKKK